MEGLPKIAIVTGSNTGIGKPTARRLAEKGFRVIMACRSVEKGREAMQDIIRESASKDIVNNLEVMEMNLDDLGAIKKFSEEFRQKYDHLDVLVNNAGVYPLKYEETVQGFERMFGVNYLGHFYLTMNLIDLLEKSQGGRVINVSSVAQQEINFTDLENRSYSSQTEPLSFASRMRLYSLSKSAIVLFTTELARRLKARNSNIVTHSLHPGTTETKMSDAIFSNWIMKSIFQTFVRWFGKSPESGSDLSVYLATSEDGARNSGSYWSDVKIAPPPVKSNQDENTARRLWEETIKILGRVNWPVNDL